MSTSPPQTTGPSRRGTAWSPLNCPHCHGIFRIPKSSLGREVICPSCKEKLRTPASSDPAHQPETQEKPALPTSRKTKSAGHSRHRRGRHTPTEIPSWETLPTSTEGTFRPRHLAYGLLALLILILTVAATLKFVSQPSGSPEASLPPDIGLPTFDLDETETPPEQTEITPPATDEPVESVLATAETVREIKTQIKNFLEAPDLETLLQHARHRERIEPLLRAYYQKEPYSPPGLRELEDRWLPVIRGESATATVVTNDFSSRGIFVELEDGTWKVDWESWVGHSEIAPKELKAKNPTKPVLVRVILNSSDYYNFEYSDETVWKAYELTFAKFREPLWGYIKISDPINSQLTKLIEGKQGIPVTLRVKYPPNSQNHSQLEIVEIITKGWVTHLADESNLEDT